MLLQSTPAFKLKNIFDDADYAWRLLQAQISLQMSPSVSGQQIAKLLQLYMKGVQKMNSYSDQRQSYFKNKVTTLMTKGVVIKSLKQNPMKKKAKHEEVHCKQQSKTLKQQPIQQAPIKVVQKTVIISPPVNRVNHIELKQKQRQFEMRVAYTQQQNNPDTLRKLILQEQCRQENISKKINSIIMSHQEKLKERIKARKLRTATYRTQSDFNQQEAFLNQQLETQPSSNKFTSNKKEDSYFFQYQKTQNNQQSASNKTSKKQAIRKWKSLERRDASNDKVRKRKYTFELE